MSEESNTMQSPEPEGGHPQVPQAARRSLPALAKVLDHMAEAIGEAQHFAEGLEKTNLASLRTLNARLMLIMLCRTRDQIIEVFDEEPEGNT